MHRILEVIPKGREGKKVEIKYYDTATFEIFTKEDEWAHITPTTNINLYKYGHDIDTILEELTANFPGSFEEKNLGKKTSRFNEFDDSNFYRGGHETTIIHHSGNREDRHTLEFFLDRELEKPKKQIFIKNSLKRFKARTRILPQEQLIKGKQYLDDILCVHEINPKDIQINYKKSFIEVKCEERQLKNLDPLFFRINMYESNEFKTESEAQEKLEEIQTIEGYHKHIDRAKVIKRRIKEFDIKYLVKITTDLNKEVIRELEKKQIKPSTYNNKKILNAREELWDPLRLNTPTSQLRDFFPAHMRYNPNRTLSEQANRKTPAFKNARMQDEESELLDAIRDANNFYLKKSAVIDLEVTNWRAHENISGNIFMAVLKSETENKIYMTKEAWRVKENQEIYQSQTKNTNLVFVEDQFELISTLSKDCENYEYIIGHNFSNYDQKHLVKFNDENKLFKENKLTEQEKNRIKELRKNNKQKRLWMKKTNQILDTYTYVKNRINILENHKLSTFAGFDKSIDYTEMEFLLKRGGLEDIQKIIDYTVEDGTKTKEMTDLLLKNAVYEQFASLKGIYSIFSQNPIKNFYDSGARTYFMNLNTYKNRNEYSAMSNLEKLQAIETPDELIWNLLKNEKQKEGVINAEIIYPKAIIEACKLIINANSVTQLIYREMEQTNNLLIKADLITKLNSFLHVPIDKIKNFMTKSGLEFGKRYAVDDLFKTFGKDKDLSEEDYYSKKNGLSDFEKSRMNFIFCAEYKSPRLVLRKGEMPYDFAMLQINNHISDYISAMKDGLDAKTKGLYITPKTQLGYSLGKINAINFKDKGLIGKINDFKIFISREKPKDELINEMVIYFLENKATQSEMRKKFHEQIYTQQPTFWKEQQKFIRVLTGIDPKQSGGTLYFDYVF